MATVAAYNFELSGADGGPLRGTVRTAARGSGRPTAVISHGFKGFKDWGFFPHLADRIARAGITAVSFNYSGSGVGPDGLSFSEPGRFRASTYTQDLEDLETVVGAVRAGELAGGIEPSTGLGLFGHSRGGATSILFASEDRNVDCLVTWNAVARLLRWGPQTVAKWKADGELSIVNTRTGEVLPLATDLLEDLERNETRLDVLNAAARVQAPWLIVQGEIDEAVPAREADELFERAVSATTKLLKIPKGSHTLGARHPWQGSTPQLDEATEATVGWMCDHLL